MRPKKHILLVDSNEQRASVRAYQLRVNRFLVTPVKSPEYAQKRSVELVIAVLPAALKEASTLARTLQCPLLVLIPEGETATEFLIADWVHQEAMQSIELLERIKIYSARKRGPRKGSKRVQPEPEAACA